MSARAGPARVREGLSRLGRVEHPRALRVGRSPGSTGSPSRASSSGTSDPRCTRSLPRCPSCTTASTAGMRRTPARCPGGSRDVGLGGPRLRGDVAADPGGAGRAGLAGVAGPLAHAGRPRRRGPRRGGARLGPAGLPAPRAAAAPGRAAPIVERHGGEVPSTEEALRALPGIGAYTAAAVACFAFRRPTVVVDTNVRRVLVRTLLGEAQAAPAMTRAERDLAVAALPEDRDDAVVWNVAAMELGALVCTARSPRCDDCPVADLCAWNRAGRPGIHRTRPARPGLGRHRPAGPRCPARRPARRNRAGQRRRPARGLARRPTADAVPRLARRRRAGRAAGRRPLPAAGLNRPVARPRD